MDDKKIAPEFRALVIEATRPNGFFNTKSSISSTIRHLANDENIVLKNAAVAKLEEVKKLEK